MVKRFWLDILNSIFFFNKLALRMLSFGLTFFFLTVVDNFIIKIESIFCYDNAVINQKLELTVTKLKSHSSHSWNELKPQVLAYSSTD